MMHCATQQHSWAPALQVLPDLTHEKWVLAGEEELEGKPAQLWTWTWHEDAGFGDWNAKYKFWVDAKGGAPLRLHMWGINLYTGGGCRGKADAWQCDTLAWKEIDNTGFDRPSCGLNLVSGLGDVAGGWSLSKVCRSLKRSLLVVGCRPLRRVRG